MAGFGEREGWPPELSEATRERLARTRVSSEDAHLAWELARLPPDLSPSHRAALQGLVLLLFEALGRGSTRVAVAEVRQRATAVLGDPALGERMIEALRDGSFEALIGEGRPLLLQEGFLYSDRVLAVETRLADAVTLRVDAPLRRDEREVRAALETVLAAPAIGPKGPIVLTDEQQHAVRLSSRAPISIISGGPGTGKTSIVVTLLRVAMQLGDLAPPSIALAAPTGKAADRMRSSIEATLSAIVTPTDADRRLSDELPAPRTIHRLLGYSPALRGFRRHRGSPLSARLVVLDEGSMIDVFLMESVIAALDPRAQLVVLGDAKQLPSVAAGAVFRDLSRRVPNVQLIQSHRVDPSRPEGSHILEVAAAINRGALPSLQGPGVFLRDVDEASRRSFLRSWAAGVQLGSDARRTFARRDGVWSSLPLLNALFERLERRALLCVTRHGWRPTTVEAVNAFMHREVSDSPLWVAGEPIVVSRNDYERHVFNGDRGTLLWVAEGDRAPRLSAVFRRDGGFAAHPLEAIRGVLELGWATTVHKAQGSEYDEVALLMPEQDHARLLTREVVYTALTRARRRVDIVGGRPLLGRAVARTMERSTGL